MPTVEIAGDRDSVLSIAARHGFAWKKIWNHAENYDLRQRPGRKPQVLLRGDPVHVPDRELAWVPKPTDQRHEFRLTADPVVFRVQLKRYGKPRADVDYVLAIDRRRWRGRTNAEGEIEHVVPVKSTAGEIYLPATDERYPIAIGRLDPIQSTSGVQQRLKNLGHGPVLVNGALDEKTRGALKRYQRSRGLEPTGDPDEATRTALAADHA